VNPDLLETVPATRESGQYPDAASPAARDWLRALLRLLLLRPTPGLGDAPGWLVVALALCAFAAWLGVDRLQAGPGAEFYIYALPTVSWYGLVLLSAGHLLAGFSSPGAPVRAALGVLFALALVYLAILAIAALATPPSAVMMGIAVVFLVYAITVVARTLFALTGRSQPRALSLGALFFIGVAYLTSVTYAVPGVWFPPEDESYEAFDDYWDRGERLVFEQPARIEASVAGVAAPGDGEADVFFMGFAGYGEERVFAEEIKLAARVVGERYAAEDRQVLLLNDHRDLDSAPIATVASLEYALKALATRMDVQEDVLFLALSSHGAEGSLSVSHGPTMLQDLTDKALAEALQNAGIRWRVIVISACHAGSFIDALRNPETIVITAASADRTSFGCSDDRDLTYFGEAFYRDALPGAETLRQAFDTATAAIEQRERSEARRASQPQAHFGEAIERHLAEHFN
jgi:hypothetical protein